MDHTLQKRQTLSMQPRPPAAHEASVAIWIPTAASPGSTVLPHVVTGALVTTGADVPGAELSGEVAGVTVAVAGAEVADEMLEQSDRCADCAVVSTLQKRHTSLMQPIPPTRHVASVTMRIPTAASPGDTDTAQVENVTPPEDPSSSVLPKMVLPDPDDIVATGAAVEAAGVAVVATGVAVIATGVAVVATGVAVVATGVAVVATGAAVVDGTAVVEL